jgi:TrmH family RNA methyltransferase
MTAIESPHNQRLKEARALQRRSAREKSGRFAAEGEDLLAAADAAGWEPLERLVAAGSGLEGTEVEPDLLARASSLGSGTRALATYQQRWSPPAGPLCVALWAVRDPGNVGAVLRSALAFGAASVALGPGCADPYGPKAVRASMGALFAVPVARVDGPADLPGELIALVAGKGEPLAGPLPGDATLLVGAERDGLPADVLAAADRVAHIPIRSESLNAAMAATVAMYEATRSASSPTARSGRGQDGRDRRMARR